MYLHNVGAFQRWTVDAFQKWEYLMVGCVQLAAWQVYADRVSILVTEGTSLGGSWSIISKGKVFFSFDQFRHSLISLSLSLSVRPSCRHHHHSQGCGCILAGNKASALQPLDKVSPAKNMLFLINSEARSTATLIILPPRNLKFLILEFVIGSVNYCGKGPKCICKVSITDHKRNNFEALSLSPLNIGNNAYLNNPPYRSPSPTKHCRRKTLQKIAEKCILTPCATYFDFYLGVDSK